MVAGWNRSMSAASGGGWPEGRRRWARWSNGCVSLDRSDQQLPWRAAAGGHRRRAWPITSFALPRPPILPPSLRLVFSAPWRSQPSNACHRRCLASQHAVPSCPSFGFIGVQVGMAIKRMEEKQELVKASWVAFFLFCHLLLSPERDEDFSWVGSLCSQPAPAATAGVRRLAAVALCIILCMRMCTASASSFHADVNHMSPCSLLANHAGQQLSRLLLCLPHTSPLLTSFLTPYRPPTRRSRPATR